MGKRTRRHDEIMARLDDIKWSLDRLATRLPERADAPDDSPFTYTPTPTGFIKQIARPPDFTFTVQAPEPDSRTPIQRAAADAPEYG